MSNVNFSISIDIDERLKERAFPIIESYGLTPKQAIILFLKYIADTGTIPLTFTHLANNVNETNERCND